MIDENFLIERGITDIDKQITPINIRIRNIELEAFITGCRLK